ncbi:hypothetical protein [Microlunatus flavus]|uniref:Uncharacterized protein n=1 Tax=Microlunatus flavus TaxID=1036181 RepID=A0A1H9C8A6_9ACTN|nr:hypothetical protein [Microlunatus flavus]SEP97495.1 hypothetical protein SAMN05421756_102113 [Microlunatus flavus]
MPLFGRWRKKPEPPEPLPSDSELVPLDVEQAALLRRLVQGDLARRGIEGEVFDGHVVTADHQIGLHNLAKTVATEPQGTWPRMVTHHLDLMLAPSGADEMSDEHLRHAVYARVAQDSPELREMFPDARHLAPGLALVLSIDYPERVATVAQPFYEERGGLDQWWVIGMGNLRRLLETEHFDRYAMGEDSPMPRFDIVEGESVYTASLAASLPDLLTLVGQSDVGRGVLVAVPDRKRVVLRAVEGAETLPAIAEIAKVTHAAYTSSAGPLSPHVFLVDAEGWHQLTSIADGTISIMLGAESVRAFDLDDRG